tara:strand:+ start:1207 stop:1635 length:429 start_codon:yes stop_codon:yes gene_type:complete
MARKSTAAPFKLKYTNGKKASPSAFFQMANESMPNPAVDQAINKKMEEQINKKVNNAMSQPGDSPVLEKGEKWKKLKEVGKKVLSGAATVVSSGLDAVYGTGKIAPDASIFGSKEKEEDDTTKNAEDKIKDLKSQPTTTTTG